MPRLNQSGASTKATPAFTLCALAVMSQGENQDERKEEEGDKAE